MLVAVRVWRHPTLGNSSTAGLFEGKFLVGPTYELVKRVWFKEAVALMLVISYLGFGAYHLYLYARNRKLPEFLWFGIMACLVAVYALEIEPVEARGRLAAGGSLPGAQEDRVRHHLPAAGPGSGAAVQPAAVNPPRGRAPTRRALCCSAWWRCWYPDTTSSPTPCSLGSSM